MASFNFNHLTFPMQAVPQQSTLPYYHLTDCCDIRLSDIKNLLLMKRVPFKTAATHKRCTVLLNRAERGLMSYEDCTIEELQRFLQQRGFAREPPSQHTRLVRLLEKMDNRAKFERFLELPPELRNAVYGFHLGGLGVLQATKRERDSRSGSPVLVKRVVAPPLCLASKQLRQEAMLLFSGKRPLRSDMKG
ncbi:uncharacterized protein CLAFUR5_13833 [Fulvia fulva]|uniref:Uncharacterized protein n=1 Tax=Passalora fulva TaxID=5499 RepID=A0A9Q8PKH4_PASFU|nr:uncharacterized protein CLAFUR5_13833 [Fulvia fulva]UJO24138.1 hypothetical protein CLAFUR5_13833 [Fulvia fulva]WPV36948.1 hypothetical protein CLAFUW7_14003 [Fulvia fulva]